MRTIVFSFLIGLTMLAEAQAQPRSPLDQLALEVAIVATHEGAFENPLEPALIWQVVEGQASTTEGRLKWLRSHSGRSLGHKKCTESNCVWSVELLRAPDKPPASIERQRPGWWKKAREQRWREIWRFSSGLVYGIDQFRPCACEDLHSWGYDGDTEIAWKKWRLVPCGCFGVNDGFVFAPRAFGSDKVLSATVARGRRR